MYKFNKKNFILPKHFSIKNENDAKVYIDLLLSNKIKQDHTIHIESMYRIGFDDIYYIIANCFGKKIKFKKNDYPHTVVTENGLGYCWRLLSLFWGKNVYMSFNKDGFLHSFNGNPAIIKPTSNSNTYKACYITNGILEDIKPCYEYFSNGEQKEIVYTKNNLFHREDGPAVEKPTSRYYYQNGKRHNTKGPAIVENGRFEFYINGTKLERKEKSIAFILYVDKKYEELENYLSLSVLKHSMK